MTLFGLWKNHKHTCDCLLYDVCCPVSFFPFPQMKHFLPHHGGCFDCICLLLRMLRLKSRIISRKSIFYYILYRKLTVSLEAVVPKGSQQESTAELIKRGRMYTSVYMHAFLIPSLLYLSLSKIYLYFENFIQVHLQLDRTHPSLSPSTLPRPP